MSTQIITTYLHSSKETMREEAAEAGLSEEAQDEFRYALYEVEFELEVNEHGEYEILRVDGRDLAPAAPPAPVEPGPDPFSDLKETTHA